MVQCKLNICKNSVIFMLVIFVWINSVNCWQFPTDDDSSSEESTPAPLKAQSVIQQKSFCNCIRLRQCLPLRNIFRQSHDWWTTQYYKEYAHQISCGYYHNEMYVCCPRGIGRNRRNQKDRFFLGMQNPWNSIQTPNFNQNFPTSNQNFPTSNQNYPSSNQNYFQPQNQYYNPFAFKSPTLNWGGFFQGYNFPHYEDPYSNKYNPPSFSQEFSMPQDFSYRPPTYVTPKPVVRPPVVYPGPTIMQPIRATQPTMTTTTTTTSTTSPPLMPSTSTLNAKLQLINDPSCGQSFGNRIVGGQDAGVGKFQFMARLAYRNKTSGMVSYRCGGILIADKYVVTAAHCVTNLIPTLELVFVRLGDTDTTKTGECNEDGTICAEEKDFGIEKVIVHPNYNNPRYANDIALIRLTESTESYNTIGTICLPIGNYSSKAQNLVSGKNGIITGWGAYSTSSNDASPVLQWIKLPFVDNEECSSFYWNYTERTGKKIEITDRQLCIQGRENADACGGDSGGPLMDDDETRYVLLGIVSFGPKNCGLSMFPGVYTRITSFLEWLLRNMSF